MYTTTVINPKGGVGKTTTAVCLATALARRGWKSLIVDLDKNSQTTRWLLDEPPVAGADQRSPGMALLDAVLDGEGLVDLVQSTASGVDIIPSDFDFARIRRSAPDIGPERLLANALSTLPEDRWDVCIIDSPGDLGLESLMALVASDGVLIAVEAKYLSLDPTAMLLQMIENLRLNGTEVPICGFVATLVDERTKMSRALRADLEEKVGDLLFPVMIRENVKLAEAPAHHMAIEDYAPKSHGALDYWALADEFVERIGLNLPNRSAAND